MKSKSKIAIFGAGHLDSIGGIQRSYQLLCERLINENFKVNLIGFGKSLEATPSPLDLAYPVNSNVNVHIVEQIFTRVNFDYVTNLLAGLKVDVVIVVNSGQAALFFTMAAKKLGLRVIYSMRGAPAYCIKYLWPSIYTFNLNLELADSIHFLMPSYAEYVPKHLISKLTVIPSPIEQPTSESQLSCQDGNDRGLSVLYSGRLSFEKRVDLLLRAFSHFSKSNSVWNLIIAGDGPLKNKLVSLASSLGIQHKVTWMNVSNTNEMYKIYPKCQIKVLPSENEGCPMALREAMAHKLPVIGYSECSGTNEIIVNDKNGLLLPSVNHVSELTNALNKLANDRNIRLKMGQEAYRTSQTYAPDVINDKWLKMIMDTLHSRASNGSSNPLYNGKSARVILRELLSKNRHYGIKMFDRPPNLMEKHFSEYSLLFGKKLFDARYYLEENLEVKMEGIDPLLHYISIGWKQGLDPSPLFSTTKYVRFYGLADKETCPLAYFYRTGKSKGEWPIPCNPYFYSNKTTGTYASLYSGEC